MKRHRALAVGIFLTGVLLLLQVAPRAMAQDQVPQPPQDQAGQDQAPAQDPPGRVAQLAYSTGSVSFQPGGQGDWVQAVTNRPLTSGDNLWADKESRAELSIGSSTIRMDAETSVTFLDLDDNNTQIKLSMGSIIVRVRHLDDGDLFEVDTPNLAFNIQRTGEYRFDVNADGTETDAAVWQGSGEATGGGASYLVVAGQRARFTGTDQLDHEIDQLPAVDDFDTWSSNRDQNQDRSESGNYVSEEVTGYEDLDGNGTWSNVAGYGPCWAPTVAVDWAPYRLGHWVWIAPWGWTWVDDEPWGFAPFHYGRWAFVSSRWYWVPGRAFVRPIYAPALVAFVGGSGFAVGVGGPGVAWFPLGPGEVYVPWYRTSRAYVNNVNITNARVSVVQVNNVYNVYQSKTSDTRITYVNQHAFAVTAVSRDTFVNARPVAKSFVRVSEGQISAAPSTYQPSEQPSHASVLGAGAAARVRPPAAVANREVIATRVPQAPAYGQSRPAMNVRAEAPAEAQPAGRGQNVPQPPASPRYQAERPLPRPQDNSRPEPPQPPVSPQYQAERPAPQPERDVRPEQPQPATAHPDMTMRGGERPAQAAQPSGPKVMEIPAPNRPLVRPAPPVQPSPELQRSEQQKFDNWQQQRQTQRPAPPPQSRPAEQRAPQPKSQPVHDDNKKH